MKTQKLFYNIFKRINKIEVKFYYIDKLTSSLCIPEILLKFKMSDISDAENIYNEVAIVISSEFYNIEEIALSDDQIDELIVNIVQGYVEKILNYINENVKQYKDKTNCYFSSIHFKNKCISVIDEYIFNKSENYFQNLGGVDHEDIDLIKRIFS